MASGPITSWQIDGETMETVRDFIFGGSKITTDGDFSHEMKRCLPLGRKVIINLGSILKSRSCRDHALIAFGRECFLEKFRSIFLDFDVFKRMSELIAQAPAVTVYTAVRAATVYVHADLFAAALQYAFCFREMHALQAPGKYLKMKMYNYSNI